MRRKKIHKSTKMVGNFTRSKYSCGRRNPTATHYKKKEAKTPLLYTTLFSTTVSTNRYLICYNSYTELYNLNLKKMVSEWFGRRRQSMSGSCGKKIHQVYRAVFSRAARFSRTSARFLISLSEARAIFCLFLSVAAALTFTALSFAATLRRGCTGWVMV